jgi:diaminopimelate epimerase
MKIWKMSGSGNDFVFVDGIEDQVSGKRAIDPAFVREVCTPHTGIGADGIAVFQRSVTQDFKLDYLNRDGSVGELCGNASLCAVRLGVELGHAQPAEVRFETGAGVITGRIREGVPEIDLQAVRDLKTDAGIPRIPGELAMGFADTGVPHLVIETADIDAIPLGSRGPELRYHSSLKAGANVNWVAPAGDGRWRMRTFERGVEAETLACGTGAVATAALLQAWGRSGDRTDLITRSGRVLSVFLRRSVQGLFPTLAGEGRILFEGQLREIP